LKQLLLKSSVAGRSKVIRLAQALNVDGFDKQIEAVVVDLRKTIADGKQSDEARLVAVKQVLELQPEKIGSLLDAITVRSSPAFAVGIIDALGVSASDAVGTEIIKRMPAFTPQARAAGLRVLLSRPALTVQYLDAVEKGTLTLSELPLDRKQALAAHTNAQIAARARALLAKGGGLPNADRQKVVEDFLPLLAKKGDVERGKAIFKKHCAICHTHSGEGTRIGPDLSGVSMHTKEHLLIDILDPSRSVEGNFRVYQVSTLSGLTHNGLLASETKTTIELFNSEGKKIVVQRDEIEQLVASPKSLMPDGFEKTLKQEELLDLLEFLTTRPKTSSRLERPIREDAWRVIFATPDRRKWRERM
jgi:putative heme-binding domain-containing protein